jgi:hypothetical protein
LDERLEAVGRDKISYFCGECGYEAAKWLGRCPGCGTWNSFCEAPVSKPKKGFTRASGLSPAATEAVPLSEIEGGSPEERFPGQSRELDRVLGGGIVPGSVILLGGAPGIGKSTLLLQLAAFIAENKGLVLYVSGEESRRQVQMRARRLRAASDRLYFYAETNLNDICRTIEELSPVLVIVDSIQTTFNAELPMHPGSIGQLRECTAELVRLAKTCGSACFLVGHVTKEGALAGPKVLEHMVDVVGDAGITVADNLGIAVTTGNSYTVAMALEGTRKAAECVGIDMAKAEAVVLGATGSIGSVCARMLAGEVGGLTLVSLTRSPLERLSHQILHETGTAVRLTTNTKEALRNADIVVAVTSSVDTIVEPQDLKPGAVVCDVARPRDVSVKVASERPDVLVIEGGVVEVPGDNVQFNFNFGFPPGTAYACMAETMILALEERCENYSLGRDLTVSWYGILSLERR